MSLEKRRLLLQCDEYFLKLFCSPLFVTFYLLWRSEATFTRLGFTRDSTTDELQGITRWGGKVSKSKSKSKATSSCKIPSKKVLKEAHSATTRRLAPKRKAFEDACSGIQSALTEQDKHEKVDTSFDTDSDDEVLSVLSVSGEEIDAKQERHENVDTGFDDEASTIEGKESVGDVDPFSSDDEDETIHATCDDMHSISSEKEHNFVSFDAEEDDEAVESTRYGKENVNVLHKSGCGCGDCSPERSHVSSYQEDEVSQLYAEPSDEVGSDEYERASFQYSNVFQWSPIKMRSPKKMSEARQHSSTPLANAAVVSSSPAAWSQEVLTMRTVENARVLPSFSPIKLRGINYVPSADVSFQGVPPEPSMCTPLKEQGYDMTQFSWHSRTSILSIAGSLPRIDIDNLLACDIADDDSMIDFVVGAPNTESPLKKMRSSTPKKSYGKRFSLASPLSVTPKKRHTPIRAGTYSTPLANSSTRGFFNVA